MRTYDHAFSFKFLVSMPRGRGGLRLTLFAFLLCLCGCLDIPDQTKKVYSGQKNFCSNFSESNIYEMLSGMGITNQCVDQITRDSKGSALIVTLHEIGNELKPNVLVIKGDSCVFTNLGSYSWPIGFYDDLTIAYGLQGDHFVFQDGFELPKTHTGNDTANLYNTDNKFSLLFGCKSVSDSRVDFQGRGKN